MSQDCKGARKHSASVFTSAMTAVSACLYAFHAAAVMLTGNILIAE